MRTNLTAYISVLLIVLVSCKDATLDGNNTDPIPVSFEILGARLMNSTSIGPCRWNLSALDLHHVEDEFSAIELTITNSGDFETYVLCNEDVNAPDFNTHFVLAGLSTLQPHCVYTKKLDVYLSPETLMYEVVIGDMACTMPDRAQYIVMVPKEYLKLVILSPVIQAQDGGYYYWFRGEKQLLEVKNDKWFLLFDQDPDPYILSQNLRIERDRIDEIRKIDRRNRRITNGSSHAGLETYWTVVSGRENELDLSSSVIVYHAPFFYSPSGNEIGLSHLFYVKLNKPEDAELLDDLAETHGVEVLGSSRIRPEWYTLACGSGSSGNALEMANLFYETGLFSAAEPDLMVSYAIQTVQDFGPL